MRITSILDSMFRMRVIEGMVPALPLSNFFPSLSIALIVKMSSKTIFDALAVILRVKIQELLTKSAVLPQVQTYN